MALRNRGPVGIPFVRVLASPWGLFFRDHFGVHFGPRFGIHVGSQEGSFWRPILASMLGPCSGPFWKPFWTRFWGVFWGPLSAHFRAQTGPILEVRFGDPSGVHFCAVHTKRAQFPGVQVGSPWGCILASLAVPPGGPISSIFGSFWGVPFRDRFGVHFRSKNRSILESILGSSFGPLGPPKGTHFGGPFWRPF